MLQRRHGKDFLRHEKSKGLLFIRVSSQRFFYCDALSQDHNRFFSGGVRSADFIRALDVRELCLCQIRGVGR